MIRAPRSHGARRAACAALGAAVFLSACAQDGAGGAAAPGAAPASAAGDACAAESQQLEASGTYFTTGLLVGAAAGAAGGVLIGRPGIISGLIFLGSAAVGAAMGAAADDYVERRRREAQGDQDAMARAVATDIEQENAGIDSAQRALEGAMDCRLRQAQAVRDAQRAGQIQQEQAAARLAALRAQAERDLQVSRQINERVTQRAATLDRGVLAVSPDAQPPAPPPPPPPVAARAPRPVPVLARPQSSAPAVAQVAPQQPVQVRPAREPGYVTVETPSGQQIGYAPANVFTLAGRRPLETRSIIAPVAAGTPVGEVRRLASTNITRRDNFAETVRDLERTVSGQGFEVGT